MVGNMSELDQTPVEGIVEGLIGEGKSRIKQFGDGEIAIMDSTGDTKTIWDKSSPDEVENAKATFDRLTAKGYTAFRVDKKGNKDGQMREFDPNAESIIFVPRMQGG
jgi:hypothetical protein